ncbi:MAG: hypothetical protein GF308_02390 [Candidatus Heimdallarchaeota archaeon]|nr:hypothetical protein [Candidatus Heimdallarchaeota archaeon]
MNNSKEKNKVIDKKIAKLDLKDQWGEQEESLRITLTKDQREAAKLFCEKIAMKEHKFFRLAAMFCVKQKIDPRVIEQEKEIVVERPILERIEKKIDEFLEKK